MPHQEGIKTLPNVIHRGSIFTMDISMALAGCGDIDEATVGAAEEASPDR